MEGERFAVWRSRWTSRCNCGGMGDDDVVDDVVDDLVGVDDLVDVGLGVVGVVGGEERARWRRMRQAVRGQSDKVP